MRTRDWVLPRNVSSSQNPSATIARCREERTTTSKNLSARELAGKHNKDRCTATLEDSCIYVFNPDPRYALTPSDDKGAVILLEHRKCMAKCSMGLFIRKAAFWT
jgi:hypothetical protein